MSTSGIHHIFIPIQHETNWNTKSVFRDIFTDYYNNNCTNFLAATATAEYGTSHRDSFPPKPPPRYISNINTRTMKFHSFSPILLSFTTILFAGTPKALDTKF